MWGNSECSKEMAKLCPQDKMEFPERELQGVEQSVWVAPTTPAKVQR